nr:response regulator [Allomuricauda sp.]
MFKKILIVEDLDTVGLGITTMLKQELQIPEVVLTKYCDEAYLKFRNARNNNVPFDLLITDLSFSEDYRTSKIQSGKELIEKIKERADNFPIIVCSVEEKPNVIRKFVNEYNVSAYVLKGRNGLKDLKKAVINAFDGAQFLSPAISDINKQNNHFEIEEFDTALLLHLSKGFSQNQIAHIFSSNGISPSSLSSIEKRLNRLKDVLKANNNVQLVANAKDLGLI